MEQLLLRPTEVGAALGLSRTVAYDIIRSGELPSVRIGRSLRVKRADLEAFVQRLGESVSA